MLRRFLAALAVAATLTASACAPSYFTTTSDPYTPGDGGWADADDLSLRNIVAVADQDGAATLVGTILNRSDSADRLVGITVPDGQAEVEPVAVPRDGRLVMGATGPGGEGPVQHIAIEGADVRPGQMIELTFNFEDTAPAEIEVSVVNRDGWYSEVPLPDDLPTPAGEPTGDTIVGN